MPEFAMTPELREKLVGLMPFSQNGTMEFTPAEYVERDLPIEVHPVYELRAWTKQEADAVNKRMARKDQTDEERSQAIFEEARIAVKNWENLYDLGTCKLIAYAAAQDGGADPEVFKQVPPVTNIVPIWRQVASMSGVLGPSVVLKPEETQGLKS